MGRPLVSLALAVLLAGCRTPPTLEREPAATGPRATAAIPPEAVRKAAVEQLLKPGPWEVASYVTSLLIPNARAASGGGRVDTFVQRLRVKFAKRLGMGGFLTLETAYEHRLYAFDGLTTSATAGMPSGSFHGMGFRARYLQAVNEEWAAFLFGRVRCEFEAGVDPWDALSWAISPGIGRRFHNGLDLGLGVAFLKREAEELYVIPGPQFTWRIDDRWSTELVGTEFLVEYRPARRWRLGLGAGFDSPRTRLNDAPPGNFGIFTDSRLPVELRAAWTPIEDMDLEVRIGVDVYRELFYADRNGTPLASRRLDPAPYFGVRWTVRF